MKPESGPKPTAKVERTSSREALLLRNLLADWRNLKPGEPGIECAVYVNNKPLALAEDKFLTLKLENIDGTLFGTHSDGEVYFYPEVRKALEKILSEHGDLSLGPVPLPQEVTEKQQPENVVSSSPQEQEPLKETAVEAKIANKEPIDSVLMGSAATRQYENRENSFGERVLEHRQALTAYAWSLARNKEEAEDLVQVTIERAIKYEDKYIEGNIRAWLFTILRNTFHTTRVRASMIRRREQEAGESYEHAGSHIAQPDYALELKDTLAAMEKLPKDQREALMLVGVNQFTYEEAAEIAGVELGTIKSRVNRARAKLAALTGRYEENGTE